MINKNTDIHKRKLLYLLFIYNVAWRMLTRHNKLTVPFQSLANKGRYTWKLHIRDETITNEMTKLIKYAPMYFTIWVYAVELNGFLFLLSNHVTLRRQAAWMRWCRPTRSVWCDVEQTGPWQPSPIESLVMSAVYMTVHMCPAQNVHRYQQHLTTLVLYKTQSKGEATRIIKQNEVR